MKAKNIKLGELKDLKTVLITGATGNLGSELCLSFALKGYRIAMLYNGNTTQAECLERQIQEMGCQALAVKCDLSNAEKEVSHVVEQIKKVIGIPYYFVHAAGFPVKNESFLHHTDALENSLRLSVVSFSVFIAALLPEMLRVQHGRIFSILTEAVIPPAIPGWHSYTISKMALWQAMKELSAEYESVGIKTCSFFPGAFTSQKSSANSFDAFTQSAMRERWPTGLDTQKLAQAMSDIIDADEMNSGSAIRIHDLNKIELDSNFIWTSREALHSTPSKNSPVPAENGLDATLTFATDAIANKLEKIFRDLFGLETSYPVYGASLGNLEGWDSLGHINLIMEIESAFDFNFASDMAAHLNSFEAIHGHLKNNIK